MRRKVEAGDKRSDEEERVTRKQERQEGRCNGKREARRSNEEEGATTHEKEGLMRKERRAGRSLVYPSVNEKK